AIPIDGENLNGFHWSMADNIELKDSWFRCAAQIEPMRVENLGVRGRRAIRKQLRVGTLLRRLARVENPCRLGTGIHQLESAAFLHSCCNQPSRAWNKNQVFRILVATYEIPSVRGCARSRSCRRCGLSVKRRPMARRSGK